MVTELKILNLAFAPISDDDSDKDIDLGDDDLETDEDDEADDLEDEEEEELGGEM